MLNLLFIVFVYQLNAITLEETFKKSISFGQGSLISVSNMNGGIEVSSWDKDEIEIIAYKKVKTSSRSDAQKLMKELKIEINESTETIEIATRPSRGRKHDGGFFSWLFGHGNYSYSVSYELKVPQEVDLNLETSNGGIEVVNITGKLRLETSNGKIIADNISGLARCHTSNGSIRANFQNVNGTDEMRFKTSNGSIKLYLPSDYGGSVDLKTSNGRIKSDFLLEDRGKRSKTRYKGKINQGASELTCTTSNGSIYLYSNE